MNSVLIILPHNPGDVVMALQAIARLKSQWPKFDFDYLVSDECSSLVLGSPLIRKVWVLPRQSLKTAWNRNETDVTIQLMNEFLANLSVVSYRLSLNFFQERFGGLLQSFVLAEKKVGLEISASGNIGFASRFLEHLSAIPVARKDNAWHVVDIYIRTGRTALLEMEPALNNPKPIFPFLPPLPMPKGAEELENLNYFAFHPGLAWPGKRWPEKNWAELANACLQSGNTIVFTGAPEERTSMDRILKSIPDNLKRNIKDWVGKTSLIELAWILAKSKYVVSGDTVAMHLAAATQVTSIALFGSSNPIETGPYGSGHVIFQTDEDPKQNFDFSNDHPGLQNLHANEIAAFLLNGIAPTKIKVWQTRWSQSLDMQILEDGQRHPHPNLNRFKNLMNGLNKALPPMNHEIVSYKKPDASPAGIIIQHTLDAIDTALNLINNENLASLELAEKNLAEQTQESLIWEAYRIAVNGLSILDLPGHLTIRKKRFIQALSEDL